MKNTEELFHAELKNFYALQKQKSATFEMLQSNIENEELSKRIEKQAKQAEKDWEAIKELLSDLEINPGNTTDSVAQEMMKNLEETISKKIPNLVKEKGLLQSLYRFSHYELACIMNLRMLAKELGEKPVAKRMKKSIKFQIKELNKINEKTRKAFVEED